MVVRGGPRTLLREIHLVGGTGGRVVLSAFTFRSSRDKGLVLKTLRSTTSENMRVHLLVSKVRD